MRPGLYLVYGVSSVTGMYLLAVMSYPASSDRSTSYVEKFDHGDKKKQIRGDRRPYRS